MEEEVKQPTLYERLSAPLPPEAVQKVKKEDSKKGYDTTGFGYQYIVNRFNEVFGFRWGYTYEILRYAEGEFKNGTKYHDITVQCFIWIYFDPIDDRQPVKRGCVGGHIAVSYADALKGAITNAFKKTAAFFGVGRQAYEGSVDDDAMYPDTLESNIKDVPAQTIAEAEKMLRDSGMSEPPKEILSASEAQIKYLKSLLPNMSEKDQCFEIASILKLAFPPVGLDKLPRDQATRAIGLLKERQGK